VLVLVSASCTSHYLGIFLYTKRNPSSSKSLEVVICFCLGGVTGVEGSFSLELVSPSQCGASVGSVPKYSRVAMFFV
jgi:hypothetical protein